MIVLRIRINTLVLNNNDLGVRRWRHPERIILLNDSTELVVLGSRKLG